MIAMTYSTQLKLNLICEGNKGKCNELLMKWYRFYYDNLLDLIIQKINNKKENTNIIERKRNRKHPIHLNHQTVYISPLIMLEKYE